MARKPQPARRDFSKEQVMIAVARQDGICPCCGGSLSSLPTHAHHKNGKSWDASFKNLIVCCEECHEKCYHRPGNADVPSQPLACVVELKRTLAQLSKSA